jgi:maltooligosyltrehalose trehalohydrolase
MHTTMTTAGVQRRYAVGAEPVRGGVHFRIWAPKPDAVAVILLRNGGDDRVRLEKERGTHGYWSVLAPSASPGDRYVFEIGPGERFPDPASRFQPDGPHGPSEVIDPGSYRWADGRWRGIGAEGHVLYELHVGTFTREGTWRSAMDQLPALADLGITVIELMPVAEFAGTFGWGYDGVDLFAPTRLYGRPDNLRAFVDRAHALGLGVILDVVYNHLGPDGCYLSRFSDTYFSKKYEGEWGDPLNFDGEESRPVREFFIENAAYWIDEFHFDGLRLDATQGMMDASKVHIVQEIGERVRRAATGREVLLVAENEPQQARLVRDTADGGYGLDLVWNDDFHHSATVALTGRREAYYTDYEGSPQEFVSAAKRGYLYQGQRYSWQRKPRGESTLGIPPRAFVTFLENHDQVANTPRGLRLHARCATGAWRAMTALMLLGPGTPMLFQGQEFAASAPFLYFADHRQPLADSVRDGRRDFLCQFPSVRDPAVQSSLPSPGDRATFERSVLDLAERERHAEAYRLHRDLIAVRRADPAIRAAGDGAVDGAVLNSTAFVLRYFGGEAGDRLLFVNLGCDYQPAIVPEPLLAPPPGCRWSLAWSSEDPAYGGGGTPAFDPAERWQILGHSALYFRSEEGTP